MLRRINVSNLKDLQADVERSVRVDDAIPIKDIRYVAGFEVSFAKETCVCAAVVVDFKTMKIVERKHTVTKAPMNYIPGFAAFREGPAICQTYYDLEYEPDVILVNGAGIAHPYKAGLAAFVGVELAKPAIGIAKNLLEGEVQGEDIIVEGEVRGRLVKTRAFANPLFVSPGHLIDIATAAEIVAKCVIPPHKLPEPLHLAHRFAKRAAQEKREPQELKEREVEVAQEESE